MDTKGNTFVVGIDFWTPSINALSVAVKFAEILDATVVAVHVVEKGGHYPPNLSVDFETAIDDTMAALKTILTPLQKKGIQIEPYVIEGNVTHGMLEICKAFQADLVFVGIREGRLLEDIFIGENTMHLLRSEDFPLVVVDAPLPEAPIQELMIPFDHRVGVKGVLDFLGRLKHPLAPKALLIASLLPDEDETVLEAEVNVVANLLLATGIENVEFEIVKDSEAHEAVIRQILVDRNLFDLVLLEHIDYSEEGRMTTGSLIEEIVTKCQMPVLCLPKNKAAE